MNPLKIKDLLPKLSEETGLPLELLRDLTDFYWNRTHKALASLDYLHVLLHNLGTFSVKGDRVIDRELIKIKPRISAPLKYYTSSKIRYERYSEVKRDHDKLNLLKEEIFKENDRRKSIKKLRREIRENKENLERQRKDS